MGNLFSRHKERLIPNEDDQFFDCLNDDESHEHNEQINENTTKTISHYYAVWIPSNVETTENQFIFDDMKNAFTLCKKYSKHNSRVKIFANRHDAENFIQQKRTNTTNNDDMNIAVEQRTTPINNDAEKLPYSDVPTSELTKLYNIVEKGDENEFERLIWSNPRYLISSGDSPTIVKISVRYNSMHVAALSGQSSIIRILIKTIKNVHFIRRLYINDSEEQTQQRIKFILDMYLNTPDKMQNESPLHLASKFGHYDAVCALLDDPSCSRDAVNKVGLTARDIVCSRAKDKSKEKKILQLFESIYYIPIYSRKITMEKTISKPVDETTFKPFLNMIQQVISCSGGPIQRVFYRFNYSSIDNTISTVEVFVLYAASSGTSPNSRITIEWNNIANNPALSTTIPRGYLDGEVLQFRRNTVPSDVSTLVPSSDGLCIDATRQSLRYKKGTSSYCFIQLQKATIQQCHDLKLNMYLYLNTFYAPASHVLAYPSANATLIQIRDTNQDKIDLDRIDQTRAKNRLNISDITRTRLNTSLYTIYDATETLSICNDVPSGIYIEFGFVRVQISPTVSFERIVSVQYNYTYSNWQFDCTTYTCNSMSTQRYLVSFQSAFIDLTSSALHLTGTTKADITSADNYIQHLLWLITPEYHGEPGYRNYTIAMILIFIAISVVVMHVLLFGMMCPF